MAKYSLGETLRSLRKQAGISQEELAEGICSPVSISRIENDTQWPSKVVLDGILEKLGSGTYELCNIFYTNEQEIALEEKLEEIEDMLSKGQLEEAKEALSFVSCPEDHLTAYQSYLTLSAVIKMQQQGSPWEAYDSLKKALALTKPTLDYADFRSVLLTMKEATILNAMVAALFQQGETIEAIRLGEEVLKTLEKHKSRLKEYQVLKINLALNLSQCLEEENRLKEALSYCEKAETLSIQGMEELLLPEIEFAKAKLYHLLKKEEDCIHILKAIVPYMELIGKVEFAQLVKEYAKEKLDLAL